MKRVYVAGAYSADNVMDVLNNMRKGMKKSTEVFLDGFAPFCPWLDFHFQLMIDNDNDLSVEDYYKYSLAWLEVSDAMLVLEGYEKSKGTIAEIEWAKRMEIPIYYEEDLLCLEQG